MLWPIFLIREHYNEIYVQSLKQQYLEQNKKFKKEVIDYKFDWSVNHLNCENKKNQLYIQRIALIPQSTKLDVNSEIIVCIPHINNIWD